MTQSGFEPPKGTKPASATNRDAWLNRIALSILDIERNAAAEKMVDTEEFQAAAARVMEPHRRLVARVHPHQGGLKAPDPVAIAGAWSGRDKDQPVTVVELPSMKRLHEAEADLKVLGEVFGGGGIYLQAGPGDQDFKIIWIDENNEPADITDREAMLEWLLYLLTDRALDDRYTELMASLREGQVPAMAAK